MAFCANCGFQVQEYDKFCPRCGVATRKDYFTTSAYEQKRKVSYDGEIKKCPHCGEVLKSFEANCPICGYELRNSNSSNYIQEFSNKLEKATTSKQKDDLIRHFVIPNTKEDIFEFMILAAANLETGGDNTDAWLIKLEQAYQKAKYIFGESSEIKPISDIYKNASKKYNKIKFHQKSTSFGSFLIKHWRGFISAILGIFAIICLIIALQDFEKNYTWAITSMYFGIAILLLALFGLPNNNREG